MRATRGGALLLVLPVLLAVLGSAVLFAAPASAAVTCADLKTRPEAQSYYEGRPTQAAGLDANGNGQACENNPPGGPADWSMIAIGVLMAAAVAAYAIRDRRVSRRTAAARTGIPMGEWLAGDDAEGLAAPAGRRQAVLAEARTGSLEDLAHGLRVLPRAERMALVEEHADLHAAGSQDVLDGLVDEVQNLELQGWALAGYDPPSTVRLMHCACVRGLRNYKRRTTADGSASWECATCQKSVRIAT